MRILLIEDHPDSRRNLCRLIGQRGHRAAFASAEEAGRDRAGEIPFLILDWMLPGKSGVDLCQGTGPAQR
jgi:OmpR-family two-component system manganese-sensing response regulator